MHLYILCNCYATSKLSNRFYKHKSMAFVFIPFLSQPDTHDCDIGVYSVFICIMWRSSVLACNRFYPYNSLYINNIGFPYVLGHPCTHWYQTIIDNSLLCRNWQCFKMGTLYMYHLSLWLKSFDGTHCNFL